MKPLPSISSIIPRYDVFFLDLWGVVHDGSQLYPGVREMLVSLKESNKKVIFLSNAPRRAFRVAEVLTKLGIGSELYEHIVSSGEAGFRWLASGKSNWGRRYYLISEEKDAGLLDELDFTPVNKLEEADFILNLGFGSDEQAVEDYAPFWHSASKLSLPMLCLNPDIEVIKISGERFLCAGALARDYEAVGGKVKSFGKPYMEVYEYAHSLLAGISKEQILAVGDSLETDIPGAKNFGIDSVLISGGILKNHSIAEIEEMCKILALNPTYLLAQFGIQ